MKKKFKSHRKRRHFPELVLRRDVKGRMRYKKIKWHWWYLLIMLPLAGFTGLGVLCLAMFFAVRFKLTNANGIIDDRSASYQAHVDDAVNLAPARPQVMGVSTSSAVVVASAAAQLATPGETLQLKQQTISNLEQEIASQQTQLCRLWSMRQTAPYEVKKITQLWPHYQAAKTARLVFAAAQDEQNIDAASFQACRQDLANGVINVDRLWQELTQTVSTAEATGTTFDWLDQQYWPIVLEALAKDNAAINKVGAQIKLNPRLIVSSLMVEQLRLFYSQRALFKQFFEPLKILSNSTQVSMGVMAIKPETARQIESHLRDSSSPYYLGSEYAHLLDYADPAQADSERLDRLQTEADNHYWSYLYGGLYIKQLMHAWEQAGFNINDRPEIICTLYNVGFAQSEPKADPKVGGSTVVVNGFTYSFGHLASEFYFSGELMDVYPEL